MYPFEKDSRKHPGSQGDSQFDAQPEAPSGSGSISDADISAAHIADLVRRTAERLAAPSASAVAYPRGTTERRPAAGPDADSPPSPSSPRPTPQVPPQARREVSPKAAPKVVAQKPGQTGRRTPSRTLAAGGAAVVVAIVGGVAMAWPDATGDRPSPGTVARSAPDGYRVEVTDIITDCASHSYGLTKHSFEKRDCVKATRSLATGQVDGHPSIFVVSEIQMKSVEAAASVKQVLDASGTGNLNDLLREGRTFQGAPERMPRSGYASVQTGTVVQVAEAGFLKGRSSSSSNPALRAAAAQVASLETPRS